MAEIDKTPILQVYWDWLDFGFAFKIYKTYLSKVSFGIDIQILWLSLWINIKLK